MLSSKRYYFCCSLLLETGSIVNPGNWGRMLRLYMVQNPTNAWILVREVAFEKVRVSHFQGKPSRFDCAFVCLSEADLVGFRARNNRLFDVGYEVELIDENASSHIGDLTLANIAPIDSLATFENRALLYWQGNNINEQELLTLSPLKVIRAL